LAFDAGRVTASLDLDRSPFIRSLAQARRSAASFARQTYEASLGVRGSAGAIAEAKAVDKAYDQVDGRKVEVDVDPDGRGAAHLQSLSGGFKSLAGNIRATGTVLAASAIPFAIAGIGAATPTVLALGASLGGLALNLGKAAAGFGLVGAAAGGGALVGLKAYGSLISKTLTDSRELWEESNEKAVEALEKQRTEILGNARGFEAYNKQLNRSIIGFTHLQAAVGSQVFPIFTRELAAWNGVLREIRPYVADTAGDIARIAVGFSRWFRTADDGDVFGDTLRFVSVSAERGARALSLIAQIGVSAFQPLIPLASDLQQNVLKILNATNRWVQSAQGQERLGEIYRGLWNDARRLWPVVRDLAISVGQFFNLLDRTGIADQASRGLRTFAHWLREATQRGGGLEEFLRNAKDLMPFVGGAAVAVAGAIGKIASAVIGAREAGSKLTILQQIFRGIGNAAKPLQGLVIGTFRDLGPAIAKLLPALSRFFGAFAGSSGPLVAFVNTLTKALQTFNKLPEPVRKFAAQLLALKVILGGLGIGAVVAPMGRFASNMVIARGAASKLAGKSALLGVAGALGRIGLVLGGGIGLAALAGTLYLVYKRNKHVRDAVDDLAGKLKSQLAPEIRKAQGLWNDFGKGVGNRIDRLGKLIVDVFDLDSQKRKIRQHGANATADFGLGIRSRAKQFDDKNGPGYEIGFTLGRGIGRGLTNWLRSRGGSGGGIAGISRPQWVDFVMPSNLGGALVKWVGKTFGPGLLNGFRKNIPWSKINDLFYRKIFDMFLNLSRKSVVFKAVQEHIIKPMRRYLKNASWGEMGASIAKGIFFGFSGFGLPGKIAELVANAKKAIGKKIREGSPAKLFISTGRNIGLGVFKGFADLNLGKRMADNVAGELRDGIVNLGDVPRSTWDKLLKQGWKGRAGDSAERLYAPNRMGGGLDPKWYDLLRKIRMPGRNNYDIGGDIDPKEYPRAIVRALKKDGWIRRAGELYHPDTPKRYLPGAEREKRTRDGVLERLGEILTDPRINRTQARFLAQNAGLVNDAADWRRRLLRMRGQMERFGFSMFEDATFAANDRMRRYQGNRDHRPVTGGIKNQIAAEKWWDRQASQHKRGIDEDGMRRVMREHRNAGGSSAGSSGNLAQEIASAVIQVLTSGAYAGYQDRQMGGYFSHRNSMGADPR